MEIGYIIIIAVLAVICAVFITLYVEQRRRVRQLGDELNSSAEVQSEM